MVLCHFAGCRRRKRDSQRSKRRAREVVNGLRVESLRHVAACGNRYFLDPVRLVVQLGNDVGHIRPDGDPLRRTFVVAPRIFRAVRRRASRSGVFYGVHVSDGLSACRQARVVTYRALINKPFRESGDCGVNRAARNELAAVRRRCRVRRNGNACARSVIARVLPLCADGERIVAAATASAVLGEPNVPFLLAVLRPACGHRAFACHIQIPFFLPEDGVGNFDSHAHFPPCSFRLISHSVGLLVASQRPVLQQLC